MDREEAIHSYQRVTDYDIQYQGLVSGKGISLSKYTRSTFEHYLKTEVDFIILENQIYYRDI